MEILRFLGYIAHSKENCWSSQPKNASIGLSGWEYVTSHEIWLVMRCQMRVLIGWLEIWARIKKMYFDQEENKKPFLSLVELFWEI